MERFIFLKLLNKVSGHLYLGAIAFIVLCSFIISPGSNSSVSFSDINNYAAPFEFLFKSFNPNHGGGYTTARNVLFDGIRYPFNEYSFSWNFFPILSFFIASFWSFFILSKGYFTENKLQSTILSLFYAINPLTVYYVGTNNSGHYYHYTIIPLVVFVLIKCIENKDLFQNSIILLLINLSLFVFFIHPGFLISFLLIELFIIALCLIFHRISMRYYLLLSVAVAVGNLPYLIQLYPMLTEIQASTANKGQTLRDLGFSNNVGISLSRILSLNFDTNEKFDLVRAFLLSAMIFWGAGSFLKKFWFGKMQRLDLGNIFYEKFLILISISCLLLLLIFISDFQIFYYVRTLIFDHFSFFVVLRTPDKLFLFLPCFFILLLHTSSKQLYHVRINLLIVTVLILASFLNIAKHQTFVWGDYHYKKYISVSQELKDLKSYVNQNLKYNQVLILPNEKPNTTLKGWVYTIETGHLGTHPVVESRPGFTTLDHLMPKASFLKNNAIIQYLFSEVGGESKLVSLGINNILLDKRASLKSVSPLIKAFSKLEESGKINTIFENMHYTLYALNKYKDHPPLLKFFAEDDQFPINTSGHPIKFSRKGWEKFDFDLPYKTTKIILNMNKSPYWKIEAYDNNCKIVPNITNTKGHFGSIEKPLFQSWKVFNNSSSCVSTVTVYYSAHKFKALSYIIWGLMLTVTLTVGLINEISKRSNGWRNR